MTDTSQSKFVSTQNISNIDFTVIYSQFIRDIDSIRSIVPITSLGVGRPGTPAILEESRCHAFYRLIGLPVLADNGNIFYTPGYARSKYNEYVVVKNNALNKINNPLNKLMFKREQYPKSYYNIFLSGNINSSVLGLSLYYLLGDNGFTFSGSLQNSTNPFDANEKSQSHIVYNVDILNNYVDIDRETRPTKLTKTRSHFIKPFGLDPRVETSASPNLVGLPFVDTIDEWRVDDNTLARVPLIETIIRQKTSPYFENSGNLSSDAISYLSQVSTNMSENLISSLTTKDFYKNNFSLSRFITIIEKVMKELVLAEETITSTLNEYHWVPIPNGSGIDTGVTTRKIVAQDPFNQTIEKEIIALTGKLALEQAVDNLTVTENAPPSFSFSAVANFSNPAGFKPKIENSISDLNKKRDASCARAAESLKNIEIILGEFTGLGLCDIMVIFFALHFIETKYLLGLMDFYTIERMKKDKSLKSLVDSNSPAQLVESLTKLEEMVKYLYTVVDVVYRDIRRNNS